MVRLVIRWADGLTVDRAAGLMDMTPVKAARARRSSHLPLLVLGSGRRGVGEHMDMPFTYVLLRSSLLPTWGEEIPKDRQNLTKSQIN